MRIRDTTANEEDQINLMPLIDMVFLLLIFFLMATTIAQEERELAVQLPGTARMQALSAPPRQVIINVLADGAMRVAGQTYDLDGLRGMLMRAIREQPQREVLIRADEQSLHRHFASVARVCRAAGVNELKIGYILEPPAPQSVR
jgi:biopolymer transport protein ExbD